MSLPTTEDEALEFTVRIIDKAIEGSETALEAWKIVRKAMKVNRPLTLQEQQELEKVWTAFEEEEAGGVLVDLHGL